MRKFYLTAGVLAAGLLACGAATVAQDKDRPASAADIKKANDDADIVQTIALASDLAEHGEKQKSGLQLLTAATLFRQTKVIPSKAKPKVTLPEGVAASPEDDAEAKPIGMQARATELFAAAKKVATEKNDALLLKLIEDTEKQESATRAGSPRSYTRGIRQGVTHTFTATMVPGSACAAGVVGNGKNSFTITVTGAQGIRTGSYTGANPRIVWNAARQPHWTIEVTNNGPGHGTYTMSHN